MPGCRRRGAPGWRPCRPVSRPGCVRWLTRRAGCRRGRSGGARRNWRRFCLIRLSGSISPPGVPGCRWPCSRKFIRPRQGGRTPFAKRENEILEGLASKDKGPFEQAHRSLGELLGFEAGKVETDGSPDPWWMSSSICFVFEDHAGAEPDSALNVDKARQAFTHPNWVRDNIPAGARRSIMPVLVTPVTTVKEGAAPHLEGVALWPLAEFRKWAENALSVVRRVRTSFMEPGNLIWRAQAAEHFEQAKLDAKGLAGLLRNQPAKKGLKPVK